MDKIQTYEEAVQLIERVGFMLLSANPYGLLSLEAVTDPAAWHTNETTDPWRWKDRLAAEKKAAYTRVLDRRPGFIAPNWYPYFLAAYRLETVEKRYRDGCLGHLAYRLYNRLRDGGPAATYELKSYLGVGREEQREFANALVELQESMDITVAGATRKRNRYGEPYGWHVTEYTTVGQWAGEAILKQAAGIKRATAINRIVAGAKALLPAASGRELEKLLGFAVTEEKVDSR